jgi:hypothetical protein
MNRPRPGLVGLLLLLCFFASARVWSQSIGGTIQGFVRDEAGPVPQAEVRITNVATQQFRFWSTDDQGRFEIREVPPGLYELRVSKVGYNSFATPPSDSLHLRLGEVTAVETITLRVAPVGEGEVELKGADIALVEANKATRGMAFDQRQIQQVPLPARDLNNLGPLAPGVVNVSSFSVASTLVAFAAAGSRDRDNNFIIDSVDNNDPLFGGAATQFINSAPFEEFHIFTGQFQAEYGRNSGSIINVVTKQGSRDFHGSLTWFGQNDAFNAMTKVEKQSGLTKPARFYENQVGATLGGPIQRDSAWFFLSYQWDRARNDLSSVYPVIATLPTIAGLAALQNLDRSFPSPTLNALLNDQLIANLPALTAAPCKSLPNEVVPLNEHNPCTTGSVFTSDGTEIPFGTYLIPKANVTDLRDHEAFARIDQRLGTRETFFFRYLLDDFQAPLAANSSPAEIGFADSGILPEWRNFWTARTQNFGFAWTHTAERALNELRLSYSRISAKSGPVKPNSPDGETPVISVSDNFVTYPPTYNVAAAGREFTLGRDSQPARFNNNVYQLQENYSISYGRHDIKLGANLNETRSGLNQISGDLGHYFYGGFAAFVDGLSNSDSQRIGNADGKGGAVLPLREFAQFYFAQDDLRMKSNLVLNMGLRYENYSPSFNAVVDRSASVPNKPSPITRVNSNFAPRVGFAWGINQSTVVRGGYGIYYNPTFLDISLLTWQSGPISPFITSSDNVTSYPNAPFTSADATKPYGIGCGQEPTPNAAPTTQLDCTTQNTISSHLRNPFVHEASFGVQTQIGHDVVVEAAYLGSRGTRLFQRIDANPVHITVLPCGEDRLSCPVIRERSNPNRGIITETTNGAFSTYNALQLVAIKRFRGGSLWNGLTLSGAYTWSHMIDNASEIFGSGVLRRLTPSSASPGLLSTSGETEEDPTPFAQNPADTRTGEKGNSSFDRRHRFAFSFVWTLPDPPKEAKILFGNWQISGVMSAQSGAPFSPLNDSTGNCPTGLGSIRPNIGNPHAPENTVALLNNVSCLDPNSTIPGIASFARSNPIFSDAGIYITPSGETVDPSTVRFVQVPSAGGAFGNAGRNILVGPGSVNIDLALSKTFLIGERLKLEFRGEVFDLLNRENPSPFAGNIFLSTAQQVSSTIFRATSPATVPVTTLASISGLTPENAINGDVDTVFRNGGGPSSGPQFLDQKFFITSGRRVQLAVRFSF